jgi:hypothetical protein
LGLESHSLDTMAHALDNDESLWTLEMHLEGTFLSLHRPNDLHLEAKTPHLGGDIMHELGFLVVVMLLVETWHILFEKSTLN